MLAGPTILRREKNGLPYPPWDLHFPFNEIMVTQQMKTRPVPPLESQNEAKKPLSMAAACYPLWVLDDEEWVILLAAYKHNLILALVPGWITVWLV